MARAALAIVCVIMTATSVAMAFDPDTILNHVALSEFLETLRDC